MMFESDMITSAPQITVSGPEMITSGLEAINSGPKTIHLLTEKIIVTREPTTSVRALVNNVVSAGISGLLLETSFKHRVELMKGFLNASVDLGPTAVFQ